MIDTVDFGLYNNVEIESCKDKELDCETERVNIGITGFKDLYSDNSSFKVVVFEDSDDFNIINEYIIYTNKFMSEDGLHYFWHNNFIPWLSKKYDCGKYFYNTCELINILYPMTDDELGEI